MNEIEIRETLAGAGECNDEPIELPEWGFEVKGDGPTTTVVFHGPDDDVQMRIDVLRAAGKAQRDFPVPHWIVLRALDVIRDAQEWDGPRGRGAAA